MRRLQLGAAARMAVAALALHLVLALPVGLARMDAAAFARLPLELPLLLAALLAAAPLRWPSRLLRLALTAALLASVLLKLADAALLVAFARPFNAVTDLFVLSAGLNLLTGTLGAARAALAVGGGALGLLALAWLLAWSMRQWSPPGVGPGLRRGAGLAALAFAGLVALDLAGMRDGARPLPDPPGAAATSAHALAHVSRARGAARDLAAYRAAAATDPYADAAGLFDRLDGRDVTVVFVESYGRASIANPLYAATHVPTLKAAAGELAEAGLAARSFWLTSPIEGGQSWLAHGTFASGLRTSDQARYGAMLASPRRTLYHLAGEAGYRTAAVMPAITLPWPEGARIGFETVLAAADLNYRGAPFNWVTMPDQYTLATYGRLLGRDPARPDLVQIALISSHAPWVPIPPMIDWDAVGDGRVFDRWARSGDPPEVIWQDRDRVRDQYRQAIDYALRAVLAFVARGAGPDAPLAIVLGDHPPVPWVSQVEGRDVPIHLIGPPDAVAIFDAWGATPGLVPGPAAPVWPMEDFRDRFLDAVREGGRAR